jgi:hypothetical protein
MTDDIIKRLREAIAAGPTPGPWVTWADTNLIIRLHSGADRAEDLRVCEVSTNTRHDEGRKNRDYIAAASPENVGALLDEIERLRAENEALAADARRYRWLRDTSTMIDRPGPMVAMYDADGWAVNDGTEILDHAELDAAIDAAMAAEK